MQAVIHITFNKKMKSVRQEIISNEKKLEDYLFHVKKIKNNLRSDGWSTLNIQGTKGSLLIKWESETNSLVSRIVSKNDPAPDLTGKLISYMTKNYHRQINSILISYI
jgi:hypothetical protein